MQTANGRPPTAPESYERWARASISRVFDEDDTAPAGSWVWAFCGIGSGVIYALLDIARAIRERP